MNRSLSLIAAACAALALAPPTVAQSSAAPKAKPAAKAKAKPAAKAAPVEPALAAANEEQKTAAGIVHQGDYACEFDQTVKVSAHARHEGYMTVKHKAQTWTMKPVLSSTGALRLEDVTGRMLMIQIANKSMVMDTKIGQRLVDGCQSAQQREFARTMDSQPREGLLKN